MITSLLRLCRWFIILTFLFPPFSAKAQYRFADDLSITASYHYGAILPEYSNLTYIVNDYVQSATLSISKKTKGINDWEQLYNRPAYGISLFYSTLGNAEVHGRELAVFPFFNLDIITKNRFNFYNQTGLGLGYVTRKFNLKNNYTNVAVGSHVNAHFNVKFGVNFPLNKKVKALAGISFDHFSNSNSKDPNLGLNYVTAFAGLGYRPGNTTAQEFRELTPYQRDHHFEFIYSIGGKHPKGPDPRTYFTSSATFEFKWAPLRAIHFGIGADMFYDTSTKTEILSFYKSELDYKKIYDFRSGIHISQEFIYSRLSLILQEGIYLMLTDHVSHRVMYNRGIVRFRASDRIFVQVAMKSHLNILDYPEFGLGLKW